MSKSVAKDLKDIIFQKKLQEHAAQAICQIYARRCEPQCVSYCCRMEGSSPLHAVWLPHSLVSTRASGLLREFQQHGTGEFTLAPIRVIVLDDKTIKQLQEILPQPDHSSIKLLLESRFATANRERYAESKSQLNITEFEKLFVVAQWAPGDFSVELAVCVPGIVDLLLVAGAKQPPTKITGDQAAEAASQLVKSGKVDPDGHCRTEFKKPIKQLLKGAAWVDVTVIDVGQEKRRRAFLSNLATILVSMGRKPTIVTKAVSEITQDLEANGVSVAEIGSEVSKIVIKKHQFDVIVSQQADEADVIIVDESSPKISCDSFQNCKAEFRFLLTRYDIAGHERMLKFLCGQNYLQAESEESQDLLSLLELGQQNTTSCDVIKILEPKTHSEIRPEALNVQDIRADHLEAKALIERCGRDHALQQTVITVDQTFEEKLRQRVYLDGSQLLFKLMHDDKRGVAIPQLVKSPAATKMSYQTYLHNVNLLITRLLQCLWTDRIPDDDEVKDSQEQTHLSNVRKRILELFITSLKKEKHNGCVIVVPEIMKQPTMQYFTEELKLQVFDKIHDNISTQFKEGFVCCVISEAQAYTYYNITFVFKQVIIDPKALFPVVIYPFISPRCTEILVDKIMNKYCASANHYSTYFICSNKTIEEQILVYKQKMSHQLLLEYVQFAASYSPNNKPKYSPTTYDQMMELLLSNGMDGQQCSEQFIFNSENAPEDSKQFFAVQEFRHTVNPYMFSDQVLQAAFSDIFDVNMDMPAYAAELYGPQDAACNVHAGAPHYQQPGLTVVQLKEAESLQTEAGILHYFQYTTGELQKGVSKPLENFQMLPQNFYQQNPAEFIQKLLGNEKNQSDNQASQAIQKLLKRCNQLDPAKMIRQTSFQQKKRIKYFAETPPVGIMARDSRTQITGFAESNIIPDHKATICHQCGKMQLGNPTCDICDSKMQDSLDLNVVEQVEKCGPNQVENLTESTGRQTRGFAEFSVNNILQQLSYAGGARSDPLIVSPILGFNDSELQFLADQLSTYPERYLARAIACVFSLVNLVNPTFSQQIKRVVKLDNKPRSNDQLWTQIYMNGIVKGDRDHVPFARLLQLAVPYQLYQLYRERGVFATNLTQQPLNAPTLQQYGFRHALSYLQQRTGDNQKYYEFLLIHTITHPQRIGDRYSRTGAIEFIQQLIQQSIKDQDLASCSLFSSRQLINDSYVAMVLLTSANLSNIPAVKLICNTLRVSKQWQISVFTVQKCFRYIVRNAALHTPFYYYFLRDKQQNNIAQTFLQSDDKSDIVRQLLSIRWSAIQVISGQYSDFNFTQDEAVWPDQGQFDMIGQPKPEIKAVPMSQKTAQTVQQQNQQQQITIPTRVVEQKPAREHHPQVPQIQPQFNNAHSVIQQQAQPPVQPLPKVQQNITKVELPIVKQFLVDRTLTLFYQDGRKLNEVITRIMGCYRPHAYMARPNLLYVPDIVLSNDPVDTFPQQLGLKLIPSQRDMLLKECIHAFPDYVAQLCNSYQELEQKQPALNPYKFWQLTKEQLAKLQDIIRNSRPELKQFAQLNVVQEWVLKKCLLSDCDLMAQRVVQFQSDPASGRQLDGTDDTRYGDQQPRSQINQIQQQLSKIPNERLQEYFIKVAQFSLGVGSGPLETLSHYQKHFAHEEYPILAKIINLFGLYKTLKQPFTLNYQVKGVTDSHQSIIHTIWHMENLRLMYMKINQIDYFIWLTRIQRLIKEKSDEESSRIVSGYLVQPTYQKDQNYMNSLIQEKMVSYQKKTRDADCIEAENRAILSLDSVFCQFISPTSTYYDKQKQYPLPIFTINDCGQTKIRQAWLTSSCYKLMFLQTFGIKYDVIEQQMPGHPQLERIRELYFQILNLWSRFHDYLITFLMIDLGRMTDLYQLLEDQNIVQDKITKKLEIIKPSNICEDLDGCKQSELAKILQQNQTTIASHGQKSPCQLFRVLADRFTIQASDCTCAGVIQENVRLFAASRFERMIINKDQQLTRNFMDSRLRTIISALRNERQLVLDPVGINYVDEYVAHEPHSDDDNTVVKPQQQAQVKIPTIGIPVIPMMPPAPPVFTSIPMVKREDPPQLPPPVKEQSQKEKTDTETPGRPRKKNDVGGAMIPLSQAQSDAIQKQGLELYKQGPTKVTEFIHRVFKMNDLFDTFKAKGQSMDQFLFVQSSCQRQSSEHWGRLYSFLIDIQPEPIEQMQREARERLEQVKAIAAKLNVSTADEADMFDKLQPFLATPEGQRYGLLEASQGFVLKSLEMAYGYAHKMRDDLLAKADGNVNTLKHLIHGALKQMQVMKQIPLNQLIQNQTDTVNKKKMAMATYFFLANVK